MRAFLKSQGGRVWRIIKTGWTEPTETDAEGVKVIKTFEKYSKEEAQDAECNDRALNALFGAVDSSQYRLISNCTEAKKAWEILETTHEGDERVKTAKIQILMTKYESLRIDDKERIADFHGRVRELANEAENLKRPFTEDSLVLKVLRALPESYAMDAKAIRQAHDIKNMTLDQLMGNLETIELQMNEEIKRKKNEKSIAFHSLADEEDNEDDTAQDEDFQEQLSLFTKQFKNQWIQKKGKNNIQGDSSKGIQFRSARPRETKPSNDDFRKKGPQCFECGGFGHIQSECANNLKKKRQAFMSTWSDDEEETEDVMGNSNCAFVTQYEEENVEDAAEQLSVLQEKWTELLLIHRKNILEKNQLAAEVDDLRKKLDEVKQQLNQTEGEKSDLKYELTQLKSYQKWMKSAGAEKIEEMVSTSKFYGDRSGIGHIASEGSKTPLDLFTNELRDFTKEPDTKEFPQHNSSKGKEKVIQHSDYHRLKNPLKKRNAILLKKFAQARAKLQTKISSEEDHRASSPLLPDENSKPNPPHAGSHEAQLDEAPLKPDLPTVFYLEYKTDEKSQRMQSTPDEIDKADEKNRSDSKQQDEPCKTTPSEPCQTEIGGDDEEFLDLLDEEPLMAISEVPFHTSAITVNSSKNQKEKVKVSVPNPVRWSKRKMASEIHTPEASSPPSKKVKNSLKKQTSNSKTPQTRTKKQQNNLPGKSPDIIFLSSNAKSFMNLIEKKHIIPQRNIDVDDFSLKTNLLPLLKDRKLLQSVTLPGSYVKQVIREFYCNINESFVNPGTENFEKVFVRGKHYDFSPAAVNEFLGTLDEQDVHIGEATMWRELTHGTRNSQHPSNKVPSSILNSSYSILLRVAACHWLATTHTNTITKAMGMLLYKIKNDIPLNLGKLIMLVSQGYVKVAADKEEPPEPLLQVDYRHFERNHFNDMESTPSSSKQGVSAVLKYLDAKLQANQEEMTIIQAKQTAHNWHSISGGALIWRST
ncbi:unnamed protein product [Cuscuta campestris]|uniref:CCHC-type domain-containing protein n=1 Tax=Cuscuta campestris TaxID=132261 RepID=A0A484KRC6_9ASTE|nr:unnamed protein product [Cuscuta campestris]